MTDEKGPRPPRIRTAVIAITWVIGVAVACAIFRRSPQPVNAPGSATRGERQSAPTCRWAVSRAIIWVLGAAASFWWTCTAIRVGTDTPAEDPLALIAATIVIGVLVGGLGQFVQVLTHGVESKGWVWVRQIAAPVGLFGWSIGIPGAVFLAIQGTTVGGWLLRVSILVMLVAPIVTILGMVGLVGHQMGAEIEGASAPLGPAEDAPPLRSQSSHCGRRS